MFLYILSDFNSRPDKVPVKRPKDSVCLIFLVNKHSYFYSICIVLILRKFKEKFFLSDILYYCVLLFFFSFIKQPNQSFRDDVINDVTNHASPVQFRDELDSHTPHGTSSN